MNSTERYKITTEASQQQGLSAPALPSPANDLYQQFLAQVRELTGAAGASLYIETEPGDKTSMLLLHSGKVGPIPELINPASTAHIIARLSQRSAASGTESRPPIEVHVSKAADGCLIRISSDEYCNSRAGAALPDSGNRRRPGASGSTSASQQTVWLGLRYGLAGLPANVEQLCRPAAGLPQTDNEWLGHLLLMGAAMLSETHLLARLLRDPTSQLSGRAEFQAQLKSSIHSATANKDKLGLLLVSPDDFGSVNQRLDNESGDNALAQVAMTLRECLRQSDAVFRYGGAVFAVIMPGADEPPLRAVADKIMTSLTGAYLGGAIRLSFSIGAVVYNPLEERQQDLDELGLLRRSDHALNLAKRNGGGCTVLWHPDGAESPLTGSDRLSGIFTANAEKDYRNMLLLWDTIATMSSATDATRLAAEFVERIQLAMKPGWVALFGLPDTAGEAEQPPLIAGSGRGEATGISVLCSEQLRLLDMAGEIKRTERTRLTRSDREDDAVMAYAVPLLVENRLLGNLYLEFAAAEQELDSSDLVFLNALAGQLAMALDRASLAARWQVEQEQESRRLRSEVHDLRQVVHSARLVYCSAEMETVLETARAAAPTDVTVLINGESGTGKEMLARAVHELSTRKGKPLITVDCGSIAQNLIEAELFGHIKGAYTGAEKASEGRIVQADGGTLFLDEIGEIPLDVQAKLLRFVQEKEIHPVGATHSRRVDVRIVAATNRDLAREAAAGKFREDLYYRLNVVTLTAPPLRDRPDDILPLAWHFLEKFAVQYEKGSRRFSAEAEERLQSYAWPGNVRELQNGILRAVVLSTAETIDSALLEFESSEETPQARTDAAPEHNRAAQMGGQERINLASSESAEPAMQSPGDLGDPWQELAQGLQQQVEVALARDDAAAVPLGRWLSEDLVLAMDAKTDGIARRAASRLGVAETTYRRQLEKARRSEAQGLRTRSDAWAQLQPVIDYLSHSLEDNPGDNAIETAREQLLRAVTARVGSNDATGSALMGITVPTYRRWLGQT